MAIDGFQIAIFTITFVVPGYIASSVMASWRARRERPPQIEFFRWIALSAACVAPWLAVGLLIVGEDLRSQQEAWDFAIDNRLAVGVSWLLIVFVWSPIVGWTAAVLREDRPRFLDPFLGGDSNRGQSTAWDAVFSSVDQARGGWILVVLTDDDWIAGMFSEASQASIEPAERDIYISDVRYTSMDQRFPDLTQGGGVLIPAAKIKLIRYWPGGPVQGTPTDD